MTVDGEKDLSVLIPEIIALLGGIISAIVLVMPLSVLLGFLGILFAPIVEEVCKVCGVFYLALYFPKALSTKGRGIALGGLAGLGFAFTENFLYIIRGEMGLFGYDVASSLPLLRVFPLISHVLNSALVGIGLVSFAQRPMNRTSITFSSVSHSFTKSLLYPLLIIAVALHLFYNFVFLYLGLGLWTSLIITLGLEIFIFTKIKNYLPDQLEYLDVINPGKLIINAIRGSDENIKNMMGYDEICKEGTISWLGGTYSGKLKNAKPHGKGKLNISDKIIYDGEWLEGKPNGDGKIVYQDKSIYQGKWKDGNKHGKGKYTNPEGKTYIGEWENGAYKG